MSRRGRREYFRVWLQPGSVPGAARVFLVHNGRELSGRVPFRYAAELIRAAEEEDRRKIPVLLFATDPPTIRHRRRPGGRDAARMVRALLRVVA